MDKWIYNKYSVYEFSCKQVEPEKIRSILDHMELYRSALKREPSQIMLIHPGEGVRKLVECGGHKFNPSAAMMICYDAPFCDEGRWQQGDDVMLEASVAIMSVLLFVLLADQGLAAAWDVAFDRKKAQQELCIPGEVVPAALIPFGYPATEATMLSGQMQASAMETAGTGEYAAPSWTNAHVKRIIDWIEKQYARPFSLTALAANLHLSSHYASHLFRKETGSTITQYISAHRIKEAVMLLAKSDAPVEEISKQVGFQSSSFFCKCFKEKIGVTPHAYRKQIRTGPKPFPPLPL